jgi:hypothetical protein
MVYKHTSMQCVAWPLVVVALFALQTHCFVQPRTAAFAVHTLSHSRAISPRRLAWQQTQQRGSAPQQFGDSAGGDSGESKSMENCFIRCWSCLTCYKVPEELQHQTESRGFFCPVCSRKFVVNKSSIRPLPRNAALRVSESGEQLRLCARKHMCATLPVSLTVAHA